MVKKSRTKLSNGLPLVVVEIPGSNSLVTSFWTRAGSRFDPAGKAGMSHFLEHLLIKKTASYPTDIKLAHVLESVGAFKNGHTNKDRMSLEITSSNKDLDLTVRILSEMVSNPLIDKSGFDSERKVIFQEQARRQSLPDDLAWEVWWRIFFSPTSMAESVLGDKKSMMSIRVDEAKKFWLDNSSSFTNLLFLSGGVSTKKAVSLAEKYFGKTKLSRVDVPSFTYNPENKIIVEKKDIPRTNLFMSFRTPGGPVYEDFYALLVLRNIFASGWSSRVFQRLRVKESLIYGFGSRVLRYYDTGAFALIGASDKRNFLRMVSVLCEELVKLREKGVSNEELKLAKGFIRGTTLSDVETSWDYTDWYVGDELYWPEKVDSPEERIGKIDQVTLGDVERVAKTYLRDDNWLLAAVGDVKEEDIKVEL